MQVSAVFFNSSVACFGEAVHLSDAEDAEALRVAAQSAQAEIGRAQPEIHGDGFSLRAAGRKLATVAVEYRCELLFKQRRRCLDITVRLCRHVIGDSLDGSRLCAVLGHEQGIRREIGDLRRCPADVQVVGVTFACDAAIRREYHVRLKVSDGLGNGRDQIARVVKPAVAEGEIPNIVNAEGCRRSASL